jgi:predicted DNA-binding ArsR family transcriptional regulator
MLQFLKGSQDNINIYISLKNLDDIHIYSGKDKPDVKYSTHDMIGLTLKEGKTLILESKTVNSCDNLTS